MSIAEDSQLKDVYARYEDTHTLIVNKQAQEENVINPLADENDDDDVDHEQIELRPVMVESEPAGDLHVLKTQTSSADLESAKPDTGSSSETHVDTREDTTVMKSWDFDTECDVEGEKIELIEKPQSATGSSPHDIAAILLPKSAYGGTQPQGDGQQQGSGGYHEEMELRETDDDSFDEKSCKPLVFQSL